MAGSGEVMTVLKADSVGRILSGGFCRYFFSYLLGLGIRLTHVIANLFFQCRVTSSPKSTYST